MRKISLAFIILIIASAHASEPVGSIRFSIDLDEFDAKGFDSLPSPQLILDEFLKKDAGLMKLYQQYKKNAGKESRSGAQPVLTPIELIRRDETTGDIPGDGRSVFQHARIIALYVTFRQSEHHGAGSDKGFFVVYEAKSISERKEKTINLEAKATLKYYADRLELSKIPTYDQMTKECGENLESYSKRRRIGN